MFNGVDRVQYKGYRLSFSLNIIEDMKQKIFMSCASVVIKP